VTGKAAVRVQDMGQTIDIIPLPPTPLTLVLARVG
jgi:hypothetical protein